MKVLILLMAPVLFLFYSCAPVFSELQSARLVGKGNIEVTPAFTTTSRTDDGATEHIQNHYGLHFAYGIANKIDLRARYEYIGVADECGKANAFGIGPKFSLLKDRIAAYVPVGFAFGGDVEGIEEFEIQPTLLFTVPAGKYIEFNPSAKGIIGDELYFAFNLGLGLSTNLSKYVIRPEYGIFIDPGSSGHYGQFSIGATFYLSGHSSKAEDK
jgi:hypothetical protein